MEQHKSELMTTIVKIMHILSIILCVITIVIISTMCYKIARYGNMTELWDGMGSKIREKQCYVSQRNGIRYCYRQGL